MSNLFEQASRTKLRYESAKGQLTMEDLWDLSLTSLDTLAQKVNKSLQDEGVTSFIPNASSKPGTQNSLRLDLLKYVIGVKVAENTARLLKSEASTQLAQYKELLANKALESMSNMTPEEIQKKITELETAAR